MSADGEDPAVQTPLIADRLAHWSAGFVLADAPLRALHQAKRSLVDAIGVALAGSRHPTAAVARAIVEGQYAEGPCTVLGAASPKTPAGAALANGTAAHVLDFDDVSYEGMVHASAAVWPAVVAAAEASDASGERLLAAFVSGVEGLYALGRAMTDDLFWRGWWTTGLLGATGAAMGAAKAMGLDAETTGQAIRFAACQATGPQVLIGTPLKPFACGRAAETGVLATLFAASGLSAPADTFENKHGFIAMFGAGAFAPSELDLLGEHYVLGGSGVTFKLFPVCAGAQSATEAVIELIKDEGLGAHEIEHVTCEVTPEISFYMPFARPTTIAEAQFSLPFAIACGIVHGGLSIDCLSEDMLGDRLLAEIMSKVDVVVSPTLAGEEKGRDDYAQPALVRLRATGGGEFHRLNPAATGSPGKPMSDARLDEKFRDCAKSLMPRAEAEALLARIRSVESLSRARDLI